VGVGPGGSEEGEKEVHFMAALEMEAVADLLGHFDGVGRFLNEVSEVIKGDSAGVNGFDVALELLVDEGEGVDLLQLFESAAEEVFQVKGVEIFEELGGFEFAFGDELFDVLGGAFIEEGSHSGQGMGAVIGEESADDELPGGGFAAEDGFADEIGAVMAEEVRNVEGTAGLDLADFEDAEDKIEAFAGVMVLLGGKLVGVEVEPMLGGCGIDLLNEVIEDEPLEAAADEFQLAFIVSQLVGFSAAEKGEKGTGSVGTDLRVEDGLRHEAFPDGGAAGQGGQAQRGMGVRTADIGG
jgi:hypothetical protein